MMNTEVKETRTDWSVTTWADESGVWHCKVASDAGWGNAGTRDIGKHIGEIRERARRAIRSEIAARQAAPVGRVSIEVAANQIDHMNVFRSLTFRER